MRLSLWIPGTLLAALPACVTVDREATEVEPASSLELLARGDALFDARKAVDAMEVFQMAAVAASSEGASEPFVEATCQVAHLHALNGDLVSAETWLERAAGRASIEEQKGWARLLFTRAALNRCRGDRDLALRQFESAWKFALDTGQLVRAVQAAHMASVVAESGERIRWTRRALETARELEDKRLEFELWSQLGWLLEESSLVGEALEAFGRARQAARALDDARLSLVADWTYGHGLRLAGRLAEARALLEDVGKRAAATYSGSRRPSDAEWVGHAERELAELELTEGHRDRALVHFRRARLHLKLAGADTLAPEVLAGVEQRIGEL